MNKNFTRSIILFCFMLLCIHVSAQNIFPATGKVGIGTATPTTLLQVKGGASRFGSLTNYATIDTGGILIFNGTAAYKVFGNSYVFRFTGTQAYGLYFNLTNTRYDLRDTNGVATVTFGANNGSATFKGGVKIGNSTSTSTGTIRYTGSDFQGYTGGVWKSFTAGSWGITGNAGTNPATNFIGTTDAQPLVFKVNNTKAGYIDFDGSKANTSFGVQSLANNATGNYNTAVGTYALFSNNSGTNNTAQGAYSLLNNTTGAYNTANGSDALHNNTKGAYNTANGSDALHNNTTGSGNYAGGAEALYNNISGYSNVAIGASVLYSNTTGSINTASGSDALHNNTTGSGNYAGGNAALYNNVSGYSNVAIGASALYSNQTGTNSVAIGDSALFKDNNGYENTAVGSQALFNNISDSGFGNNVALGFNSLYENINGFENSACGSYALYSNIAGIGNTAIGADALITNDHGDNNTAVGISSLGSNLDGAGNTGVGYNVMPSNIHGGFNTAVGYNADVVGNANNSMALGHSATVNISNACVIGNATITSIGGIVGWSTLSDGRFKKNVETNVPGLSFVKQLRPVTYTLDIKGVNNLHAAGGHQQKMPGAEANAANAPQTGLNSIDEEAIRQKESIVYTGLVAQEVEQAASKTGFNFSGIHKPQNDYDNYSLDYSSFVMPLIKSVQELSKMNDAKDAAIDTLKKENADLKNQFAELKTLLLNIQQKQEQCSPCNAAALPTQPHNTIITDGAALEQNAPNPFTHTTTIGYTLPQRFSTAQIMITDKNGKTLKLVNLPAGRQGVSGSGKGNVNVDAAVLAAGAYNYSLLVDGRLVGTKQMVLAR